jgi:hypothetical protein
LQRPQFAGSVATFTHPGVPARVTQSIPVAQTHRPLAQLEPVGQTFPQAPQFVLSAMIEVSHPSRKTSQSAKPELQVSEHMMPLQPARVFGGIGQGVQVVPHVAGSVFDTHSVPHRCAPVTH